MGPGGALELSGTLIGASQKAAELAAVISKGRGKMSACGSKFFPDVIISLVAYIRQLAKSAEDTNQQSFE